jgi:hypothetical protein
MTVFVKQLLGHVVLMNRGVRLLGSMNHLLDDSEVISIGARSRRRWCRKGMNWWCGFVGGVSGSIDDDGWYWFGPRARSCILIDGWRSITRSHVPELRSRQQDPVQMMCKRDAHCLDGGRRQETRCLPKHSFTILGSVV